MRQHEQESDTDDQRKHPVPCTGTASFSRPRRDDIHEGFLALACCLICWQQLDRSLRQTA
jgi:hypothetical protein